MVDWIQGPVITLKLEEFKIWWDGLLHDLDEEWRIGADIIITDRSSMAELFDPLAHLLELLIKNIISIININGWLARWEQRLSGDRVLLRTGALYSLFFSSRIH